MFGGAANWSGGRAVLRPILRLRRSTDSGAGLVRAWSGSIKAGATFQLGWIPAACLLSEARDFALSSVGGVVAERVEYGSSWTLPSTTACHPVCRPYAHSRWRGTWPRIWEHDEKSIANMMMIEYSCPRENHG